MRLRSFTAPLAALAVAGLVGCGSAGSSTSPGAVGVPGAASATATPSGSAAPTAPGATAAAPTASAPGTGSSGTKTAAGTAPASAKAGRPKPTAAPRSGDVEGVVDPRIQGDAEQVPISAQVTPACVARGGLARLTVKATPKSHMSYVAIYNGEKSGAAKPWGEGHGGNDKGVADHAGNATFTWIVGVDAPTGPARVLLVVATGGKQRAINVPFSVSEREADGCGT